MHTCTYTSAGVFLWRPEESIRSPEAGITGMRELLNMGAEKQTLVLCKSSKCSQLLSHLSSTLLLLVFLLV